MDTGADESEEIASSADPVRTYSPSEISKITCNLVSVTTRVHAGAYSRTLDAALACELHKQLFAGVRDHAGMCRAKGCGTEVLIYCGRRSPNRDEVPEKLRCMMRELDNGVNSCLDNADAPEYYESAIKIASWAHAKLIEIQPFEDGNKRVARLLLNVILIRLGVSAVPLELPHDEYLRALLAYLDGDKQLFEDMIIILLSE